MKLSEYVTQVINDPKYGHDIEWIKSNLNRAHIQNIEADSEPQGEPSDAQAGTRGELLSLVKSLDYENLSLLSGMTQSELRDRNMRARANNGEDGSGW